MLDEESFAKIIETQKIQNFNFSHSSQKLAEIIFTSGSTGKSKGVMISHQNIISNTNSVIEYLEITSNDISLVILPFYYCYGLSLLHTHLKAGSQIVLNNTFMFLNTFINDIKRYRCTSFSGVPSHYQKLLKKSKTFKEKTFPSLRYVTQAGGKLHNIFIEEFTAIINPPDSCIMAVGSIIEKPIVKEGQLAIGNMMKVTLSCDHRVVDGATGAKFLQTVKDVLEDPIRLLV